MLMAVTTLLKYTKIPNPVPPRIEPDEVLVKVLGVALMTNNGACATELITYELETLPEDQVKSSQLLVIFPELSVTQTEDHAAEQ